jgi:hypothetical protein
MRRLDPSEKQRHLSPESQRRARRLAWLYAGAAAVLMPWIVYLAITLPRRNIDLHYRAAWVGFDCLLVFVIIRTAYMAFRVDQRMQFSAIATATLLLVDAWFDVTTSGSRTQFVSALVLAAFVEIPSAVFSIHLARQVNRRLVERARLGDAATDGDRLGRRDHPSPDGPTGPPA